MKRILLAALATAGACAPVSSPRTPGPSPQTAASESRWVDSVLAGLTLREKAAQMVWPTVYGNYTPGDSR